MPAGAMPKQERVTGASLACFAYPDVRKYRVSPRSRIVRIVVASLLLGVLAGGGLLWRANVAPEAVLRTTLLPTPHAAERVIVDEQAGRAIVIGEGPYLHILDTSSGRLLHTTVVGGLVGNRIVGPAVVSTATGHTFVVGEAASTGGRTTMSLISMVDTRTGMLVRTIAIPDVPGLLAVDEQGGHLFMVSSGVTKADATPLGPGSVSILDARNGTLLRHVMVSGLNPFKIAVAAATARLFVVNYTSNTVSILDTRSGALIRSVQTGAPPYAVAVSEKTGRVFVAITERARGVRMLDARTGRVLRTTGVGFADAMAVDVLAGRVIVAHAAPRGAVSVLDATSGAVITTIKVGGSPTAVAVDARTHRAFITSTGTDMSLWLHRLGHGQLSWAGEYEYRSVTVLDTRTGQVLRTVPASATGDGGVAVDAHAGHAFVLNQETNSVLMLDAAR